jgi:hypothetical protein
MKEFLNSNWLRAGQFFRNTVPKNEMQCQKNEIPSAKKISEIQCQKMKYSTNFIDYKIQPFLTKNNRKNGWRF